MQLNSEVISNFRDFIQTNCSIEDAQKKLKKYRNVPINTFTIKDSRCIWMSLLLFKFKKDFNVSDALWIECRQLILSVLRSETNIKEIIINYLKILEAWQKEDLVDLVTQIGGNYYNLLQIKNSIEKTGDEETINHWLPHYQSLIQKIRNYCKNIDILDKLDNFIFALEQQKYDIIKEIMDKAYWDKIEEDIEENKLDITYANLTELKVILLDIIPKTINTNFMNENFDIDYIKHLVDNKIFNKEYLLNLFIFVIGILKEWDSDIFKEKYDYEIKQIKLFDGTFNKMIRYVLQKLLCLSVDLKNRKALWNIIFKK
jgi:hypothetical protein